MNRFSYYITTQFIPRNKYYNSYHNPNLVYQMYPKMNNLVKPFTRQNPPLSKQAVTSKWKPNT